MDIMYLRFANVDPRAGLEPPVRRVACRSRWPRTSASRTAAASTTRSARCATSSRTTCCRCSRWSRWSRPRPARPPRRDPRPQARPLPGDAARPTRDRYVRGQYEGYRKIKGVEPDSETETFVALRLEVDNWRWAGVPFFIRAGKALAGRGDRGAGRSSRARRRLGIGGARCSPTPTS